MDENTTAAGAAMDATEPQTQTEEISVDALMDNLNNLPAPEEDAQEEAQEETPEQAQRAAYTAGLQALMEDGWTSEELDAFTRDAQVHADIAAGKSVERAATAYARRKAAGPAKPAGRKSVPTVRSAAGAAKQAGHAIDEMTDEEFAAFSRRAQDAMMMGKSVRFD